MKRILTVLLIISGLICSLCAGEGKDIEKQSAKIVKKTEVAATDNAQAYSNIFRALKKDNKAGELEKIVNKLKVKDAVDLDDLEKMMEKVKKYGEKLEGIDLSKEEIDEKGKENLGISIVYMAEAGDGYNKATEESKKLLPKAQKALKGLSGFSAMKEAKPIKNAIGNCKWVAKTAPPQTKQLAVATKKMTAYCKDNGIPIPSKEDVLKKVQDDN